MCINTKKIRNRKYSMNKKNGGVIPPLRDSRQLYVDIPCGQCYVCRKKKARECNVNVSGESFIVPN